MASLKLAHGALRNQKRAFAEGRHRADSAELAGTKEIAGIVERADNADGSGLRIHLAIREDHVALVGIDVAVGERQLKRNFIATAEEVLRGIGAKLSGERQIFLLADRKASLNGIHR